MTPIAIDGTTVHVHVAETGDGAPLVLLPSGAGEARDWRRFQRVLPHHRCLALDLYGSGATPAWSGPRPFTIDHQVRLVAALVNTLDGPAHVCGHSYGGAVALRFASTYPRLVRSLAVVEPQCYPLLRDANDPLFDVPHALFGRFCSALERGEPERGWREFIDYFNGAGFWERLRPELQKTFVATSPVERWSVLFSSPTTIDDVRSLRMPTLVVCGERTTAPERRMCDLVASGAPRGMLAVVADAGHMSPITHPAEVAGIVGEFVGSVEG